MLLRNHLGIRDDSQLEEAEYQITRRAALNIEFSPPPYSLDYLCFLHHSLFQDIYPWAGAIRTIDLSKGATRFCTVDRIVPEAQKLFQRLEQQNWFQGLVRADLVMAVAELYGDLNIVHPFRDGNGRAQRLLFEHIVINAGYEIDWSVIDPAEWLQANIGAVVCDFRRMQAIFEVCIGS